MGTRSSCSHHRIAVPAAIWSLANDLRHRGQDNTSQSWQALIFRWYEVQPNGGKQYRKKVVGTVVQFPTGTAARKASDALALINLQPHIQAAVRRSILTVQEICALLAELQLRDRTLVLLHAGTGLRIGELLAMKWQDMDFENLELHVRRSVVD
jgi:integrase